MKKILKLKKIRNSKKKNKKEIRKKRSVLFWNKNTLQMESPHNTNDYLININSSPFWNFCDEEDNSWEMAPNNLISIKCDTNYELDTLAYKEIESTDETIVSNSNKDKEPKIIQKIFT